MARRALVVVVLISFLVLPSSPADALSPPSSFAPDDTSTDVSIGTILSDRDNGVDSLVHLTVVAQVETERVEWYMCPVDVNDPVTQAQIATCSIIGADLSPTLTGTTLTPSPADEAYEMLYDIPSELDKQTRDLLAIACVGAGTDIEGLDANCSQTNETRITLDDASTGAGGQTTSGRIVSYCVSDLDGPSTGDTTTIDPCEAQPGDSPLSQAQQDAVTARFRSFHHGSPIPENGFVLRARTSTDLVDGGSLRAARDFGSDAGRDPAQGLQSVECSLLDGGSALWECAFPNDGLNRDDNIEQSVWVYETAAVSSGEGFCVGAACTLDSAYVASMPQGELGAAAASFLIEGAGCRDPLKQAAAAPGDHVEIVGCLLQPFNGSTSAPVTFESSGAGGFIDCGSGVAHDHDGDTEIDHCHATTGADGSFSGPTLLSTSELGAQTVRFCHDPQNAAPNPTAPPAGHGCADESGADVLVLQWQPRPGHVHLVVESDVVDPCHSGPTTSNLEIGDTLRLQVCTASIQPHVAASTAQVNGGSLFWALVPAGDPSVEFVSVPDPETGTDGSSGVVLEARRTGATDVVVRLCNQAGSCSLSEASVQLQVSPSQESCADGVDNDGDGLVDETEDPGCDSFGDDDERGVVRRASSEVHLSYVSSKDRLEGEVSSGFRPCEARRDVTILKVSEGPDRPYAELRSSKNGSFSLQLPASKPGRYYALAAKQRRAGDLDERIVCLAATSRRVRV